MKYSNKQKQAIKQHYNHYYSISFAENGNVYATKSRAGAKGLLYTENQAIDHLKTVGLYNE